MFFKYNRPFLSDVLYLLDYGSISVDEFQEVTGEDDKKSIGIAIRHLVKVIRCMTTLIGQGKVKQSHGNPQSLL